MKSVTAEEAKQTWIRPGVPNREDYSNIESYIRDMLDNYFTKFYINEGHKNLLTAIENWLLVCEEEFGGPGSIGYGEMGEYLSRPEGARLITLEIENMAKQIQQNEISSDLLEETPQHILDSPNPILNDEPLHPEILIKKTEAPFKDLDILFLEEWNSRQAEEMGRLEITRLFNEYCTMLDEQKRIAKRKEYISNQLVSEINKWSHPKFHEPKAVSSKIKNYLTIKYAELKKIIPGIHHNPVMKRRIRREDIWARYTNQTKGKSGDELFQDGGICNTRNTKKETPMVIGEMLSQ
ncbi:hypothetical protein G6F47_013369 [Rhizopus delemar]|nr:hypothetical protein G6F47_013369 [Rhizopus delemar]